MARDQTGLWVVLGIAGALWLFSSKPATAESDIVEGDYAAGTDPGAGSSIDQNGYGISSDGGAAPFDPSLLLPAGATTTPAATPDNTNQTGAGHDPVTGDYVTGAPDIHTPQHVTGLAAPVVDLSQPFRRLPTLPFVPLEPRQYTPDAILPASALTDDTLRLGGGGVPRGPTRFNAL